MVASARAEPIVGNKNAIAVNQAWAGHAGSILSQSSETFIAGTKQGAGDGNGGNESFPLWQVYAKPLVEGGGKVALLLLNISPESSDITVDFSSVPTLLHTASEVEIPQVVSLSDVWTGKAVAHTGDSFTAKQVPAHGSIFLIAESSMVDAMIG